MSLSNYFSKNLFIAFCLASQLLSGCANMQIESGSEVAKLRKKTFSILDKNRNGDWCTLHVSGVDGHRLYDDFFDWSDWWTIGVKQQEIEAVYSPSGYPQSYLTFQAPELEKFHKYQLKIRRSDPTWNEDKGRFQSLLTLSLEDVTHENLPPITLKSWPLKEGGELKFQGITQTQTRNYPRTSF